MRVVEYRGRLGPEAHPIYELDEARGLNLEWHERPWVGLQSGMWMRTDDDKVVQALRTGTTTSGGAWVRTCTGTFNLGHAGTSVDTKPRASRYSFNGKHRGQSHRLRPSRGLSEAMEAFVTLVARGWPLEDAYRSAYPTARDTKYIRSKALELIAKQEVKDVLDQKIGDIMDQLGISERYILEGFKELSDTADKDAVRLGALQTLAKIRGIIETKKNDQPMIPFVGVDLVALQAAQSQQRISSDKTDCLIEDVGAILD